MWNIVNTTIDKLIKKIYLLFPEPQYTRLRNLKLFEWMNSNYAGKRILNLGSGVGRFDSYLTDEIEMINLDIDASKPHLDIIADAHSLPFKNDSFDIVYSIAVLEHVRKPWIVADEITRILKPGGYIVLELPFLNVIHDEHDYFRFTDKGIKSLFDESKFDVIFEQVGSGGGSFFSVFLLEYTKLFIPTKFLKKVWSFIMRYPFSMIKYFDIIVNRQLNLRITANSFTFIGRKK